MKDQICLVEDDPTIRQFVGERLQKEGYLVDTFNSAEPVAEKIKDNYFWDLYILDILLEGSATGLDLCQLLKQSLPTVPILILSALSEPSDRIEGLKIGADDYLTKPFEMEELLLRVAGMLQRRTWYKALPKNSSTYRWGENRINFQNFEATSHSRKFQLSQKECMIMKLLIERENEVVARDEILNRVWGYNAFPSSRTVDNFILRLRKYFERVPSRPEHIHSVRGAGYKFTSEVENQ